MTSYQPIRNPYAKRSSSSSSTSHPFNEFASTPNQAQKEAGNNYGVLNCIDRENEFQSNVTNQNNQYPLIGLYDDGESMNRSTKTNVLTTPIEYPQNFQNEQVEKEKNQVSNHEDSLELQSKIATLQTELESIREQNFDLNATLLTVQAESNHEIKSTHSKTDEKIRLMQDTLRRCEMENNKLKAMLAEEKKKRRDLSIKNNETKKTDSVASQIHPINQEITATQSLLTTVTPTTEMQKVVRKRNRDSASNNNIMNMSSAFDNELNSSISSTATKKSLSQLQKTDNRYNESPIPNLKKMRSITPSPRRHQYPNDYELAEFILSQQRIGEYFNPFSRTTSSKRTEWIPQTKNTIQSKDKTIPTQSSMNGEAKTNLPSISAASTSNMLQIENSILSSILQEMISSKGSNQQNKTIVLIKTILRILSSHYNYIMQSQDGMTPILYHNSCIELVFMLRLFYIILSISPFAIRNLIHWSITTHVNHSMPSSTDEGGITESEQNTRLHHDFPTSSATYQQITISTNSNYKMIGNEYYNLIETFDSLIYHFIVCNNHTQDKQREQNHKIQKLSFKFGKLFRIESMRILTLLVFRTENKLFQKNWYKRLFFNENLSSSDNKVINDEIRKECNLFSTIENILDINLEGNESQKLELLNMISCLLAVTPPDMKLSLENKKKIAFPCLQFLENWKNGIHLLPTSLPTCDTYHFNNCLDIVYRIIQLCEILCREWEDGVTIFFCFLMPKEKKKSNNLMIKTPLSGIAILIETFNAIVFIIFMSSPSHSSNDSRLRLKQLLSKILELFTLIVNHTQNLRQIHEENNVEVSEWISFLSIISERQEMFCSCCNLICNQESNNDFYNFVDEKVKRQIKMMLEEIECDIDEVDEMRIS